MALTVEDVKKNVAYKHLPIVILDERWHQLFPEKDKTPKIRELELKLKETLKRQGQITNDLKAVKKIKADLMKEIIANSEAGGELSESKRQKLMARNQKLIQEANDKIDALEQEEVDIPETIRTANLELVLEGIDVCYHRIHKNYDDIQLLGKWINETRIELKKKILMKTDKETKNEEIYTYMHDLLGAEMMEIFDTSTGGEAEDKT